MASVFIFAGQYPAPVVAAGPVSQVKEVNVVFIHGMGSCSSSTQLLSDAFEDQAKAYVTTYEIQNPGTSVQVNILQRSYPNDVDIDVWAANIADAVKKHFAGKKDLILVGHSAGGKSALYGVSHNIENLGDIVNTVVTINSPVKDLNSFYLAGGGSAASYIKTRQLTTNNSLADSLATYDSSADGLTVSKIGHWLALISSESAPLSSEFNVGGVDQYPQDMDDGLVPITAQYAPGADAAWYGDYGHSSFNQQPEVAAILADKILRYIFGVPLQTSTAGYTQTIEHHAGWLPYTFRWVDIAGESTGNTGVISHSNTSFFKWQEWEDTINITVSDTKSKYSVLRSSLPWITAVTAVKWLNPDDPKDARIVVKTRAAPRATVRADWEILQFLSLPNGVEKDHYEIKVTNGASLAGIRQAVWYSFNGNDPRVRVNSEAEGPFRWFNAEVTVFYRRQITRKLIDEFIAYPANGNVP